LNKLYLPLSLPFACSSNNDAHDITSSAAPVARLARVAIGGGGGRRRRRQRQWTTVA